MITTKTCLVLGAGASVPYGLPTGPRLSELIIERCAKVNDKRQKALHDIGFSRVRVEEFVQAFAASRQPSIDAFLAHRPEFIPVGKAAIAATLIGFESPEALLRPADYDDDWFQFIWSRLQSGGKANFTQNRLSVVSFNYDRSFQRLLVDAYRHSFGVMEEEAFSVATEVVPLVQVHGSLGNLSHDVASDGSRRYSTALDPGTLRVAAAGLRVLSEGDESSAEFETARRLVRDADKVILLGCAYHRENMSRIGLSPDLSGTVRQGSAFSLTNLETQRVQASWGIATGEPVWKSLAFLRERVTLD